MMHAMVVCSMVMRNVGMQSIGVDFVSISMHFDLFLSPICSCIFGKRAESQDRMLNPKPVGYIN
jgi:hypothetical protein